MVYYAQMQPWPIFQEIWAISNLASLWEQYQRGHHRYDQTILFSYQNLCAHLGSWAEVQPHEFLMCFCKDLYPHYSRHQDIQKQISVFFFLPFFSDLL